MLETKLVRPILRSDLVRRRALIDRLLTSRERPVVAVFAPAGFGKTTLLAQWADADDRPFAWYRADERDSDPATLLSGIAATLDRVAPLDPDVLAAIAGPGRTIWTRAFPRLAGAVATLDPFVLVVDEVDRITEREALDEVVSIIVHLARGSQVAVAGRSGGSFPIARLTTHGEVLAIGREELALDKAETRAVVMTAGARLDERSLAELHGRTEGWAAGVYLAAIAARSGRMRSTAPGSPDRLIDEYVRSEILERLSPDDLEFMLRTSVLEDLEGGLCDAVVGQQGSGVVLDRLERSNQLLVAQDADRAWYRYHAILRDLLRAELRRRDPTAHEALLRRASAWYEEHGATDTAIEYAIAAGDTDRAGRLVLAVAQIASNAGHGDTLVRWLDWLETRDVGQRYPELAAIAAMTVALGGDAARSARWVEVLERAPTTDGSDARVAGLAALVRVIIARGGPAAVTTDAATAVSLLGDDPAWVPAAHLSVAIAALLRGEVEAADVALVRTVEEWERHRTANNSAIMALAARARIAIDRGDWAAAEALTRRARSIALRAGLGETSVAAPVDVLGARLAIHHGAIAQARASLAHAQRLLAHLGWSFPWLAVSTHLDMARARIALGDGPGARTMISEAREVLARRPDLGTLRTETADVEARVRVLEAGIVGASSLTASELRLLPLLTTHLSFREIGDRLVVSHNTVKTQAISIYRKLEATSRSEAIDRAVALGLLESSGSRPDRTMSAGASGR